MVCAEGEFGEAVVSDLAAIGITVELCRPAVPGSRRLGIGRLRRGRRQRHREHRRRTRPATPTPDAYLAVRQRRRQEGVVRHLRIDSVYIATEVIAREVLARILDAGVLSFVEHVLTRTRSGATRVRDHPNNAAADGRPNVRSSRLGRARTAVAEWLGPG